MEYSPKSTIGKRVYEYLKKNPMTATDFGKKVGVTHDTILRLLKGSCDCRPLVQFKIEKFFDEESRNHEEKD